MTPTTRSSRAASLGPATNLILRRARPRRGEGAALYQALHRLSRQGVVDAEWRASDNNRRAS